MMAVASASAVYAQEWGYGLLVNTRDGNVIEFAFEYCPIATFEGSEMVITDDYNVESIRFNMADINNLTIQKPGSKIESVTSGPVVKVAVSRDAVTVEGLKAGVAVRVHDAAGAIVATATAGADGRATIATDGLGKGVYVASMAGNSFKFIR